MTEKDIIQVNSLDKLADFHINKVVIAIGIFDGVHLGHQFLLGKLLEMAAATRTEPAVLTFFPHPRQILNPGRAVKLITTPHQKTALIRAMGIKTFITLPFTREFAALSPKQFIEQCCLSQRVTLCGICVGRQWRFGRKGTGTVEILKQYAEKGHFLFETAEELSVGNQTVSSTAIRRAIVSGCLEKAEKMLGRPFRIHGKIIHGRRIASSELSFPTANIESYNGIIPPNGVYAGYAIFRKMRYPSAIAVGVSPTFHFAEDRAPLKIEAHILDFNGDLYGKEIELEFYRYLREERCYTSADILKNQIRTDLQAVREILEQKKPAEPQMPDRIQGVLKP